MSIWAVVCYRPMEYPALYFLVYLCPRQEGDDSSAVSYYVPIRFGCLEVLPDH